MGFLKWLLGSKEKTQHHKEHAGEHQEVPSPKNNQVPPPVLCSQDVVVEARPFNYKTHALKDFVVLDFETTGLSPTSDTIIEVAALKVLGGNVADTFSTLINPDRQILPRITQITGITNGMVKNAPFLRDVIAPLHDFLGDLVLVAHNAPFDIGFLKAAYYDAGISAKIQYVDTVKVARASFPNMPNYKLSTLIQELGISDTQSHRALSDVQQTYELLLKCLDQVPTQVYDAGSAANACFCGMTFTITGTLETLTRSEAQTLIEQHGGRASGSISRQTTYLVAGVDVGTKYQKAKDLGIPILSENEFLDLLNASANTKVQQPTEKILEREKKQYYEDLDRWISSAQPYWEQGEYARKNGQFEDAIKLFDKAKECECVFPFLYESYAKIYRKLKDYKSEIQILDEGIDRLGAGECIFLIERREKASKLLASQELAKQETEEKARLKAEKAERKLREKESAKSKPKCSTKRPILQMDDSGIIIKEFPSIAAAEREIGVSSKSIREAANGVQKHAGGYCWCFKVESTCDINVSDSGTPNAKVSWSKISGEDV
ncbi:exonuclease domain-containing protein [Dysosmobacter sp.]